MQTNTTTANIPCATIHIVTKRNLFFVRSFFSSLYKIGCLFSCFPVCSIHLCCCWWWIIKFRIAICTLHNTHELEEAHPGQIHFSLFCMNLQIRIFQEFRKIHSSEYFSCAIFLLWPIECPKKIVKMYSKSHSPLLNEFHLIFLLPRHLGRSSTIFSETGNIYFVDSHIQVSAFTMFVLCCCCCYVFCRFIRHQWHMLQDKVPCPGIKLIVNYNIW